MAASNNLESGIAIVGLAGRFPGAANYRQYWHNLVHGVESISHFQPGELEIADLSEAQSPNYVRARSILENVDHFDASFFGIYPREAKLIDPQQRVFLENCWECLEDAGYDPARISVPVGLFAGCSHASYFLNYVCRDRAFIDRYLAAHQVGQYTAMLGAMTDSLATRVAYKLNLRGPACTILTACSTSLVAVSQACSSLETFQCDMALAGGVSITFPQKRGYLHQDGGMVSPDGHCRPFDAHAQGTVFGAGSGVVLLKRLADAIADRDHIYAVIRGWAINNDGASKAGFTAPSAQGQAEAIATAQALAGVEPREISYIEAHGTGTPLGDPVEFAALKDVFRASTRDVGFCAIGTAKANIGHLDVAAGVAGLIKTALSLQHRVIPPLLHFKTPNPSLGLAESPFYVAAETKPWTSEGPRIAGVSAFGVGGTNAHVIVQEAPAVEKKTSPRQHQLLILSAKSVEALARSQSQLADFLDEYPPTDLAGVAYTLAVGRGQFAHRTAAVVTADGAPAILRSLPKYSVASLNPEAVFLFPGQGSQTVHMGKELHSTEPLFRRHLDAAAEMLRAPLGRDLREVMFGGDSETLNRTEFAQPALFAIEYALAQLWLSWGVKPAAMAGHSVGEITAACLAGVFRFEDALTFVAERGRLMQSLPGGAMLSVRLPAAELLPRLKGRVGLAAVNSAMLSVAAGPFAEIEELEKELAAAQIACRRLPTSHAFHSAMLDPILDRLTELASRMKLHVPRLPYYSCVTGNLATAEQATDPAYWARHCRQTVQFSRILETLRAGSATLLEVGPGVVATTLARQHSGSPEQLIVPSLAAGGEEKSVLQAAGALWAQGFDLDWRAFFEAEEPSRVALPTYPFERVRCWVDTAAEPEELPQSSDVKDERMASVLPSRDIVAGTSARLIPRITAILADLSGLEASGIDPQANFLELGFDSLFLTQLSQAIANEFSVQITFRQLLDQLSSVQLVADYLQPLVVVAPEPAVVPPSVSGPSAGILPASVALSSGASGSMEEIIREQLRVMTDLMARQLEAAKAASGGPSMAAVAAAPLPAVSSVAANEGAEKEFKPFGPYKPIQKISTTLTPEQEEYLRGFIVKYTAKTGKSQEYTQKYRKALADPRVAAGFRAQWKQIVYPLVVERSSGSRLWDLDGNEYIDILNGFGPIAFGHRPEFVTDAVARQLAKGMEIGPMTPLAGRVAELLCELTGLERATFCNTGSEAVMAALRLARTVTGRKKIVLFAGAYHGNFDEVLVKAVGKAGAQQSRPIAPGIPPEAVSNMVVLEYGKAESLTAIRAMGKELAAVLIEPVQSRHPDLQPREFLHEIRAITEACGAAMIMDEVVTGFRLHQGGAQAYFGVRADLATYGKVLGGGLPIGAIAGSSRFMDALDGGMWDFDDDSRPEAGVTFFAGTFVRHPLALAAAEAILEHVKASGPQLQEALSARCAALVARLNASFKEFGVPVHVETCGSLFYFSIPAEWPFGSLIYYHLREKGIHLQEGFPCFVTTAHSDEDLDRVANAFAESLREMQGGHLLPTPDGVAAPIEAAREREAAPEKDAVPMTEAQLEILLSARIEPAASCAFNESLSVHLRGPLDEGAMEQSLQAVVDRHQALRARFDWEAREVRFAKTMPVSVARMDLSDRVDAGARLQELVEADASTPFDLATGPLFRASLVRLTAEHHVLLFTAHHIICDGWSANVVVEELGELYSAARQQRAAQLGAVLPFSRYAERLHREAESASMTAVRSYWLEQFRSLPPVLDLPLDAPRGAVKTYAGATIRRRLSADLTQRMKKAGAKSGATLMGFLLTGFYSLLFRLTRQDDVVVGVPWAAQSQLTEGALVGHAVNFLALRAGLKQEQTFAELLAATKRTLLDAYEHQDYTFGTLVRELGIPRDPSRLPLIEVQFNLEKAFQDPRFDGLQVTVEANAKSFVNFDLFLNASEGPDGIGIDCDFNTDLLDEATVGRWLDHFETLLEAAAQDPQQRVSRLPLMKEEARLAMLAEARATAADYPRDVLVQECFERQVARSGGAEALRFEGQSLTYQELEARANAVAGRLQGLGVEAGARVAVCLERSPQMVVALLGILKAGATYVPLDPAVPKDRIRHVLDVADVAAIVTQRSLEGLLAGVGARRLFLDETDGAGHGLERREVRVDPMSAAYLIFTSGSTGTPKGVEVPHRAVVNFLYSMAKAPGLTASDRLLAVTTLSFDIAVLELFLPLMQGASVVMASREDTLDGGALAGLLEEERITVLQATPATWQLLLESGWRPGGRLKMLCGGEALPRALANQLLVGGGELWNMYGPTETTVWSSTCRVEAGEGAVLVGPAIANTELLVLDEERQLCPVGVPGELAIGGEGLAVGYFRDAAKTADRFIAHPYGRQAGERIYMTGDLVRMLPNGYFEFLGRLDNQVKIRGFRIELGEIESVIRMHPQVVETVVLAQQGSSGDKKLVAYVAGAGRREIVARELRDLLSTKLPSYMIPAQFVSLPELPKTPNGKIDRRALVAGGGVAAWAGPKGAVTAPRTPQEERLAGICREILGLPELSVDDSLFELGIDSLRIFQVVARASTPEFPVTVGHMLRLQTVAAICEAVLSDASKPEVVVPRLRRVDRASRAVSAKELIG